METTPEDLYMAILDTAVQNGPFTSWDFMLSGADVAEHAEIIEGSDPEKPATYMGHFHGVRPGGLIEMKLPDGGSDWVTNIVHLGLWREDDGVIYAY